MEKIHHQKDLAPRDIVARSIAYEMGNTPSSIVYLDATFLDSETLPYRFPTIFNTCLRYGIDIRKDQIPITPAAHYMIGGISTDLWARTTVPGLYACGEAARTGAHGANRLASNSLLEAAVFARRVVRTLKEDRAKLPHWPQKNKTAKPSILPSKQDIPTLSLEDLQQLMWDNVGLIRNEQSLKKVHKALQGMRLPNAQPNSREQFEFESMLVLGKLMAESALERQESRGTHYREDFPNPREPHIDHITKRLHGMTG